MDEPAGLSTQVPLMTQGLLTFSGQLAVTASKRSMVAIILKGSRSLASRCFSRARRSGRRARLMNLMSTE